MDLSRISEHFRRPEVFETRKRLWEKFFLSVRIRHSTNTSKNASKLKQVRKRLNHKHKKIARKWTFLYKKVFNNMYENSQEICSGEWTEHVNEIDANFCNIIGDINILDKCDNHCQEVNCFVQASESSIGNIANSESKFENSIICEKYNNYSPEINYTEHTKECSNKIDNSESLFEDRKKGIKFMNKDIKIAGSAKIDQVFNGIEITSNFSNVINPNKKLLRANSDSLIKYRKVNKIDIERNKTKKNVEFPKIDKNFIANEISSNSFDEKLLLANSDSLIKYRKANKIDIEKRNKTEKNLIANEISSNSCDAINEKLLVNACKPCKVILEKTKIDKVDDVKYNNEIYVNNYEKVKEIKYEQETNFTDISEKTPKNYVVDGFKYNGFFSNDDIFNKKEYKQQTKYVDKEKITTNTNIKTLFNENNTENKNDANLNESTNFINGKDKLQDETKINDKLEEVNNNKRKNNSENCLDQTTKKRVMTLGEFLDVSSNKRKKRKGMRALSFSSDNYDNKLIDYNAIITVLTPEDFLD